MAYGDFKDLTRATDSDKNCVIKHLMLLKIRNTMDINVDLLQWFINFLIKKTSGMRANKSAGSCVKNQNILNK